MSEAKKILFIGINYRYVNPTVRLLPAALSSNYSVRFYGPGYVPEAVLDRGIERYLEDLGGVDLVVATKDFCSGFTAARLSRFVRRYTVMLGQGRITDHVMEDVARYLARNRERVLVSLIDVDPHAVPQVMLDAFLEHGGYFYGWGRGFLDTLGQSKAADREGHMRRKRDMGHELGLFDGFMEGNHSRVINLGHFVAESEFCWTALANRDLDIAVPGSRYARRADLQSRLRREDVRVAEQRHRLAFQAAERVGLRPLARYYVSHLYGLAFQRVLSRTRACVTDGGMNNYPVRKFFEIPAAGALLVCWPAIRLESLGFADGVNSIFVSNPSEVIEIARAVAAEPDRFEAVAAAGRELVARRHSLNARAAQLRLAIDSILEGTFAGSSWQDGEFVLAPAAAAVGRRGVAG